jgi:hypothetical protein
MYETTTPPVLPSRLLVARSPAKPHAPSRNYKLSRTNATATPKQQQEWQPWSNPDRRLQVAEGKSIEVSCVSQVELSASKVY